MKLTLKLGAIISLYGLACFVTGIAFAAYVLGALP